MGFGFWPWNFQEFGIQGQRFVLSRISKGKVTNLKIPGTFSNPWCVVSGVIMKFYNYFC